ncbi:hypothetical protein L6R50_08690 [Myxococcota bacterium]|nr:hypothetical protein [Myxococcota bacterium]
MPRVAVIPLLLVAALLDRPAQAAEGPPPGGPALAAPEVPVPGARRPKPRRQRARVERGAFVGELIVSGGPALPLVEPVLDRLDPGGGVSTVYGFALRVEGHAVLSDRISVWTSLGYSQRHRVWDAPQDDRGVPDLKVTAHRPQVFHVGVRLRPFLRRFTPYLVLGGGLDLGTQDVAYGGSHFTHTLPGLGLEIGVGLDVFINRKVAFHVDVRDCLTVHGRAEQVLMHQEPLGGDRYETTTAYDVGIGIVEDTLDVTAGVLLRFD